MANLITFNREEDTEESRDEFVTAGIVPTVSRPVPFLFMDQELR